MTVLERLSCEIVDQFDGLLDDNNILIPDESRTGDESEASLYGMTYFNLCDEVGGLILDMLYDELEDLKDTMTDIINESEGTNSQKKLDRLDEMYLDTDSRINSIKYIIDYLNTEKN